MIPTKGLKMSKPNPVEIERGLLSIAYANLPTLLVMSVVASLGASVALSGAGLAAALVLGIGARRGFAPVTMVVAGLLIGKGGLYGNVLRIAPPMTVTEAEIDEAADVLVRIIGGLG